MKRDYESDSEHEDQPEDQPEEDMRSLSDSLIEESGDSPILYQYQDFDYYHPQ